VNQQPTVSIITPTYNSSRTLRNCLESIENRDYLADKTEIAIIDTSSYDDTVEIAKQFTSSIHLNPCKIGKAMVVKHANDDIPIDFNNIPPEQSRLRHETAHDKYAQHRGVETHTGHLQSLPNTTIHGEENSLKTSASSRILPDV